MNQPKEKKATGKAAKAASPAKPKKEAKAKKEEKVFAEGTRKSSRTAAAKHTNYDENQMAEDDKEKPKKKAKTEKS